MICGGAFGGLTEKLRYVTISGKGRGTRRDQLQCQFARSFKATAYSVVVKCRSTIAAAIVALLATAAAAVVLISGRSEPEPQYKGRTLSQWLTYDQKPGPAEQLRHTEAVLKIGTNALPTLLRWVEYNPPAFTTIAELIAEKLRLIRLNSRTRRIAQMSHALRILGSNAAPAIPALRNLASRTN